MGEYVAVGGLDTPLRARVIGTKKGTFTLEVRIRREGQIAGDFYYREVPVDVGTVAEVALTPRKLDGKPPELIVTHKGVKTSVPAVIRVEPSQQLLKRSTPEDNESKQPAGSGWLGWLLFIVIAAVLVGGGGAVLKMRRSRKSN